MRVTCQIFNPQKTMQRILDNKVGIFTAETCGRYFNPYVPMQRGNLSQNYRTEAFKVIYDSPYANRQYNGTSFNFSKEMHPLASAEWDRPAMTAKRGQISKEITDFIKRR